MKRVFFFALVVSVAVAAPASRRLLTAAALPSNLTSQAGNAAFRDGLHLGRFDAGSGRTRHLSVGRWSSETDRTWFVAGYQAGYRQQNAATAVE
jgi:hypothetical protein